MQLANKAVTAWHAYRNRSLIEEHHRFFDVAPSQFHILLLIRRWFGYLWLWITPAVIMHEPVFSPCRRLKVVVPLESWGCWSNSWLLWTETSMSHATLGQDAERAVSASVSDEQQHQITVEKWSICRDQDIWMPRLFYFFFYPPITIYL